MPKTDMYDWKNKSNLRNRTSSIEENIVDNEIGDVRLKKNM
jgi:hypothetical protein